MVDAVYVIISHLNNDHCFDPASKLSSSIIITGYDTMGSFMHVVWVALVCAAIGAVGWFVTPKGKNQE